MHRYSSHLLVAVLADILRHSRFHARGEATLDKITVGRMADRGSRSVPRADASGCVLTVSSLAFVGSRRPLAVAAIDDDVQS